MKTCCALLLLACTGQVQERPADQAEASAEYRSSVQEFKGRWRYITVPPGQEESEVDWHAAISWAVCNASQAVDLGAARPIKKGPTVLRIDLELLGWDINDWLAMLKEEGYPYQGIDNPLFVRGDWLVVKLLDSSRSNAYLRLQFGDPAKLDRDVLLRKMGVDRKRAKFLDLDHGLVETQSQVAANRVRVLEFLPRLGGHASGTRDFLQIAADNSPLEFPDFDGVNHDGEEWIVGLPRHWPGGRGVLQSYFLADGEGDLVNEAPVRLVEDKTRFRNLPSIRFPGSCMACHRSGLNSPTKNGLQAWMQAGVSLEADSDRVQARLERWHLTDTAPVVKRAAEDTEAAAQWVSYGLTQDQAVDNVIAAVAWHDKPLDLEQAARELRTDTRQLSDALKIGAAEGTAGGHLVALLQGQPIRRDVWESVYQTAAKTLEQ